MLASLNWPEAFVLTAFIAFLAMLVLLTEVSIHAKDDE